MEHVEWESGGTIYRAMKFEKSLYSLIDIVSILLQIKFWPTKVIGSLATILEIRGKYRKRMWDDTLTFLASVVQDTSIPLVLEVDRRANDFLYVLYDDLEEVLLEAVEFAGLDELP